MAAEIQATKPKPEYEKVIKYPYMIEFLQIKPDPHVYKKAGAGKDKPSHQFPGHQFAQETFTQGMTPPISH